MHDEWSHIAACMSKKKGAKTRLSNPQSVSGGCINQAWKATDQDQRTWFIKTNKPARAAMFEAELLGLEAILASHTLQAPKPLCTGATRQHSFIVMEYLQLGGHTDAATTGLQLAKMHQHTQDQNTFGWERDNTIGTTPQINNQENHWVRFWKKHRLQFQLNLALKNGLPHRNYDQGIRLAEALPQFFTTYQPVASLLHGDLWGGNCSATTAGNPVIYDPAVYFGDRETDLAMTELFGGFGHGFMESYHAIFPIDAGYSVRKTLYNLYHILNHYNLFGGGYETQASRMIDALLSEVS